MALSRYCGPRDIITLCEKGEEAEKEARGLRRAQNYHIPFRLWTARDKLRFLLKARRPRYTKHMSVGSLRERIDESVWNEYYKFCVDRNPFDRLVSLYYWRTKNLSRKPPLLEFLRSLDDQSLSNFHIYSIDGLVQVDTILRYEQLDEGLETVCKHLGLGPIDLSRAKSQYRRAQTHYHDLMSDEARGIVERACQKEIELLGYEF